MAMIQPRRARWMNGYRHMNDTDPQHSRTERQKQPTIDAQDARGGEIILRTRRRRTIFIAGLVGFVLLVIVLTLAGLV